MLEYGIIEPAATLMAVEWAYDLPCQWYARPSGFAPHRGLQGRESYGTE